MNFRKWLVTHLPARSTELRKALEADTRAHRERQVHALAMLAQLSQQKDALIWEIEGDTLLAEWDHPRAGQGFFTIRPEENEGTFGLHRDSLARARSFYLGGYPTYREAQLTAEKVVASIEEQYA